jgi:type IV pilus assembly protein PilB
MEVLTVTDAVRNAIVKGSPSSTIRDLAVSEGMVTLKDAGMLKVQKGITSLHAALEVTGGE